MAWVALLFLWWWWCRPEAEGEVDDGDTELVCVVHMDCWIEACRRIEMHMGGVEGVWVGGCDVEIRRGEKKKLATYHELPNVLLPFDSARRRNWAALNCMRRASRHRQPPPRPEKEKK